jgi:hypothetical protein
MQNNVGAVSMAIVIEDVLDTAFLVGHRTLPSWYTKDALAISLGDDKAKLRCADEYHKASINIA